MRIVGTLFQRVEHVGARGALVHQRAIAVILEEMTAIEYRQGDGHVEVRCRGHIAEYITVRVLLPMTVRLLEAELDEEAEELPRVERTGDVRGVRVVRLQRQTHQPHAQDARQPRAAGHPSNRGDARSSPDRPVPRESRHDVVPTTGTLSILSRDNARHSCYRTACDANARPSRLGPRAPFSSRRDEARATLPPPRHSPPVVVVVLLPST